MNNFKAGQPRVSQIKYFNLLEGAPGTDANISRRFMNLVNAGRLPSQYFYILGHASPEILVGYKGANRRYNYSYSKNSPNTLWNLLDKIRTKGYTDGQTIVILACQAGNKNVPIAEMISRLSGVGTVYGFTALGWFGEPFYSAAQFHSTNKNLVASSPARRVFGHWRIFNTAAAGKINR